MRQSHSTPNGTLRDPLRYTLGTAAKATGKSKTTLQRAIVSGLISATKLENGGYSIDPSELHRVFPLKKSETVSRDPKWDTSRPPHVTPELQAKIEALEALLTREREALDDLRADRDAWRQQATALLAAPPKRRSWWPWGK